MTGVYPMLTLARIAWMIMPIADETMMRLYETGRWQPSDPARDLVFIVTVQNQGGVPRLADHRDLSGAIRCRALAGLGT